MRFRVWGLGFGVYGLGRREILYYDPFLRRGVSGSGFRKDFGDPIPAIHPRGNTRRRKIPLLVAQSFTFGCLCRFGKLGFRVQKLAEGPRLACKTCAAYWV